MSESTKIIRSCGEMVLLKGVYDRGESDNWDLCGWAYVWLLTLCSEIETLETEIILNKIRRKS